MGNSGSGPDQPRPTAGTTRLNHDTPPFHPKFTRTDSTTAEVGSDRSMSDKSANSSFPLSEAALPTTFDTSDDFSTSQLSHFFPLPPTKLNNSNSPSLNTNIDRPRPSLQETLDAIWAPPKASASIRISAPPTPQNTTQPELEPLIDLSDGDSFDGLSTLPTFRTASSVTTLAMASLSIDTSFDPLAAFASSPKPPRMDNNEGNNSSGSIRMDNGETIPSPVTYADAANIASKYPELRGKVLKEPLASPTSSPRSAKRELAPVAESGIANASVVSINPNETVSPPCMATTTAAPAHTADRPNWALAPDEPDAEVDRHRERRPQAQGRRDQSARDRPSPAPKPSYTPQTQNGSRAREWRDHQGTRDHSSPASQTQNELDDKWGYTAADENRNQSQNLNQSNDHEYHNARNGPARQRSEQHLHDPAPNPNHDQPPHIPMVSVAHVHPSRARNLAASGFSGPPPPPLRDTTPPRRVQNEFTPTHDAWAVPQSPQRQPEPLPRITQAPNSAADEWTTTHDGWAVQQQQSPQRRQEPLPPQSESPVRPIQQQNHAVSPGRREDDWMPTRDAWAVQQSQSPRRRADDLPQHQRPSNDTWSVPQHHQPRDEFVPAPRDPSPARPCADEWTASHDPWALSASRNTTPRNEPRPLPPSDEGYNSNNTRQHNENYAYDRSSRLLEPEQKPKQDFEEVQLRRKSPSPFRDRMNDGASDQNSFSHGSVLEVRRTPAQSSIAELAASRAHGYEENNNTNSDSFTRSTTSDGGGPPAEFDYFLHSNTMSWTDEPAKPEPESTRPNMFSPTQRIMSPTRAVPDENAPSNNYASRSETNDTNYSQPRYNDSGPADNSFNSRGHSGSATRHGYEQDRRSGGEDDRFVLEGLKSEQRGADDFAARWGRDGMYSSSQQDRYDSAPKDNWGPTQRNDSNSQKKESWGPVETKEEQWGGTPSGSDSRNRDWETPATKDRHGGGEYSNSNNSRDRDQHANSSFGSSSTSSTGSGYRRNGPLPSQWDEFSRYCDARGIPRDRFGHGGGGGGGYGRS